MDSSLLLVMMKVVLEGTSTVKLRAMRSTYAELSSMRKSARTTYSAGLTNSWVLEPLRSPRVSMRVSLVSSLMMSMLKLLDPKEEETSSSSSAQMD